MKVLKKVTFYFNHDRWEAYSRVARVNSKMSDMEIAKGVSDNPDDKTFYDNYFIDNFDGITTDFDVSVLETEIIDLT